MRNKALFSSIAVILLFLCVVLSAETQRGIEFSIRFYDKKIYYPDSDIFLHLEIANNSSQTFRFKAANMHQFNIEFDVKTFRNERLGTSGEFIMLKNSNQHVFYRDIDLLPGERYSFVVNLKDFIEINQPGAYVIQGFYYPELAAVRGIRINSNHLTLSVRPGFGALGIQSRIDEETGEVLRRQNLPPDQVVEYLINARQKEQWNRFLLYLDLENLMLQDQLKRNRYMRMSDQERQKTLEEFRQIMTQPHMGDSDILLLPSKYEIMQTTYTRDRGRVEVRQWYRYPDFTEIKQFTYHLRRQDDIWMITNYETRNLGTE